MAVREVRSWWSLDEDGEEKEEVWSKITESARLVCECSEFDEPLADDPNAEWMEDG
jgi:hypothetical protein